MFQFTEVYVCLRILVQTNTADGKIIFKSDLKRITLSLLSMFPVSCREYQCIRNFISQYFLYLRYQRPLKQRANFALAQLDTSRIIIYKVSCQFCFFSQFYAFSRTSPCIYQSTENIKAVCIRKTNQMSLFVYFISLLIVAQHDLGNHVPIIRS